MTHRYQVELQKGYVNEPPPHPEQCSTVDEFLRYTSGLEGPLVADLFCGAGGLSLGLEEAGFQTVLGIDHDEYALETFRSLFGGLALNTDLGSEEGIEFVSRLINDAGIEVVAGGPPCQPFSRAGRATIRDLVARGIRDPHDHRRDLWQSFLEVVSRTRPEVVLIENVPDMALEDEGLILRLIAEDLEEQGYAVEARLVDAWRYGVPQHRQRLIVVALANRTQFTWPDESELHHSVDEAISDLPPIDGGWMEAGVEGWLPYEGPQTDFQRRARRAVTPGESSRVYDHVTRSVRPDDLRIFEMMDADTRYSEISEDLKRYRDDIFDDRYKRLNGSDLSRTIIAHLAKDGYGFIHPYQNRTISVREAARLQTFTDEVRFAGPPTAQLTQIGNAVPPLLARELGRAIRNSLERGRRAVWTRMEISALLHDWYRENRVPGQPWLEGESVWTIRVGEALLRSGDPLYVIRPVWSAVEDITGPQDVVSREEDLRRLASKPSRREEVENVIAAARAELAGSQFKWDQSWRLAHLASAGSDTSILYTGRGVLRVVARVTGTNVDRERQGSDGRLLAASFVGVEPYAREANLALVGIASSLCLSAAPRCWECPLREICVFAEGAALQAAFDL